MKALECTLKEILELTTKIEYEYPELYPFLDENPQVIPKHRTIEQDDFNEYLNGLKDLLDRYVMSKGKLSGLERQN
ncbi:hypothetical protein [Aquimarina intermedia]|uniref:Uncharacterized protein n=1 Tax=Aquimarina intermedia TaxID=350814 RepID=A0A5S5C2B5_9FLAO|nr:hypothetical protein [Aquimarina intermedia]TYP73561.1 hypothetical protein BD809_105148 [Aquimarina intermedia]